MLELLKKLITGSHRLRNRQTDLVSGIAQPSAGHLTTTHRITATAAVPFSETHRTELLQGSSSVASGGYKKEKGHIWADADSRGVPRTDPFFSTGPRAVSHLGLSVSYFIVPGSQKEVGSETKRCWRERDRAGEGADHLFPVFSQLRAWHSRFLLIYSLSQHDHI